MSTASEGALAGVGTAIRLGLRLTRRQITIWAVCFLALIPASVLAMEEAYPDQTALDARAMLLDNPAAVMMTGPAFAMEHYTFWAMVANELLLYLLLPSAIMSVLLAVRLTRAEEESGRLELLRSLPMGRLASPLAAVIVVLIADAGLALATTVGVLLVGAPTADAVVLGLAVGITGAAFGAVAAVWAQITEHAGAASGGALGGVALAFVLRGFGDVMDRQGSWLSWTSPFAWAQQTRVFVDLRTWPLLVGLGATAVLLVLAAVLARRRDLGAGLRPARPGRSRARAALLSPQGVAARLLAPVMVSWGAGLALFGVGFGMLASSIEDMVESIPGIGEWVPLDMDDIVASFAGYALAMVALGPAGLLIAGILRMRTEETAGRLAWLLLGGGPRIALALRWSAVVLVATVGIQLLLGLAVGLGVQVATGDSHWVGDLLKLSAAQLPGLAVYGALGLALYGVLPRWTSMAWVLLIWSAVVLFLGDLLGLPEGLRALSPFDHVPASPGAEIEVLPLAVMSAMALVLATIGLVSLRRRDLVAA